MPESDINKEIEKAFNLFCRPRYSVEENASKIYMNVPRLRRMANGEIYKALRAASIDFVADAPQWEAAVELFTAFDLEKGKNTQRTKDLPKEAEQEILDRKMKMEEERESLNKSREDAADRAIPIIDYKIISSKTEEGLQGKVRDLMKFGWQPQGGVSAAAFGISPTGGNRFVQAMVKNKVFI